MQLVLESVAVAVATRPFEGHCRRLNRPFGLGSGKLGRGTLRGVQYLLLPVRPVHLRNYLERVLFSDVKT